MVERSDLHWADYLIIIIHFIITVAVGLYSTWKSNRGTANSYFLAGRDMKWWAVGMSLYVSNIGSTSFVGMSGAASAHGLSVICYEFSGIFSLLLLGFYFVPIYIASGAFTMPEYLKKRFGGNRCQIYLATQNMLLFVFVKLSAEIYAGSIIIQQTLGWSLYPSVLMLLIITAFYTLVGGLTAVIYTDVLQTVVLLLGAVILAILGFVEVGGYQEMVTRYMAGVPNVTGISGNDSNNSCLLPDESAFHIFRPITDHAYPWLGTFFGANILSAWYFCTEQVLVQRSLAAKNLNHAKAGSILAGYMKILPIFLMVWPGMISRALYADDVACADPVRCKAVCGNPRGCSNIAYPLLVIRLMPIGLRGLMLAAMVAAFMSSLTSIFNSASTVFTIDMWKRVRKGATEKELMVVGRIFIVVFAAVSVAWLPIVATGQSGQLFNYIQSVSSYLAPPVLACFTVGSLWARITEPGAFYGLLVGLVLGVIRMVCDFIWTSPGCGQPDYRPGIIANFHYLHYAMFLFAVSIIVTIVVSLLTTPIPGEQLVGVTWFTREVPPPEPKAVSDEESETDGLVKTLEVVDRPTEVANINKPSFFTRLVGWICGTFSSQRMTPEQQEALNKKMIQMALSVDPKWRKIITLNGIVLFAIGAFVWGYFA
ncbi:sodium/glucose cotransporter 4-like [Liolophura sinensis]|uniref:sodium/glucose cotransporter 4-like n=1 Tax=Liolophura sinensis TaxID=3198878 RepID=UPI003158C247